MAIETELKLSGPQGVLDKLKRLPLLRQQAQGRARTVHQTTTYFDSGKCALAKAGIALRIRAIGRRRLQTVKWPDGGAAGNWQRHEEEATLLSDSPDPALIGEGRIRKTIEHLAGSDSLKAVFVTDIKRTSVVLSTKPGTKLELSWDVGAIKRAGLGSVQSQAVSELELELKEGAIGDLFALAEDLIRIAPVRLSLGTKAERGYALVRGETDRPVRAAPLDLNADEPATAAIAKILAHAVAQMLANEGAILRDRNPEGVHQMRVALRRLRSAYSAFGALLSQERLAVLKPDIAWLTGTLGLARDLDVFQESILAPVEDAFPGDPGLTFLADTARTEKRKAWETMQDALKSERYRLAVLRLTGFIAAIETAPPPANGEAGEHHPQEPIGEVLRARLSKRLKKVSKLGKAIDELSIPERHELRIQLKKLRYLADFGQSCFPRQAVADYLGHLSRLQDLFGQLNDAAVAEDMVARLIAAHDKHIPDLDRAGGLVVGWHRAMSVALWHGARKAWRRFAKTAPYWRE